MKKSFYWGLVLAVGLPVVFGSCKKDDDPEPVDPIVGTWKIDVCQLTEVPANFSNYDNLIFTGYYYGEDEMTFVVKPDKTYTRQFVVTGPDISESGTWTKESKSFHLKSNDTDLGEEDFTIETDLTAESISMVLSQDATIPLVPDAISTPYLEKGQSIPSDTVKKYRQSVDVKVLLSFDKTP